MPPQSMGPPTNLPPGPSGQEYAPPQLYGMGGVNQNQNIPGQNNMGMGQQQHGYGNDQNMGQNNQNQRQPAYGTGLFPGGQSWSNTPTNEKSQNNQNSNQNSNNFDESPGNFSNSLPLLNEMDLTR